MQNLHLAHLVDTTWWGWGARNIAILLKYQKFLAHFLRVILGGYGPWEKTGDNSSP